MAFAPPARARRRWLVGGAAIALVIACSSGDAEVGCSPTPSCSAREERFAPVEGTDGGPAACNRGQQRCEAIAIAAGESHTCAIARAGELLCWGGDSEGQLGDGSDAEQPIDELSNGFRRVLTQTKRVAAGRAHTCAITEDGAVSCWGRNVEGQIDGTPSDAPMERPVVVARVAVATEIAAGDAHTCAVVEGGVTCWGSARFGQVGREVADASLGPAVVSGTAGAVAVAAGAHHTCALFGSGRVACWGETVGPEGAMRSDAAPALVDGLEDATALSAGGGHTCAIRAGGRLVCWGSNDSGQLGDGTMTSRATPSDVVGIASVIDVSCGGGERGGSLVGHTCVVDSGFFVKCWGRNAHGQLGIGTAIDETTPQTVLERPGRDDGDRYLDHAVGIEAGGYHTCALDDDGPINCWGDDTSRQLGAATDDEDQLPGRAVRVERFSRR